MTWDERTLRDIVRKAIQEGKLFELVFTEQGRRLWSSWTEKKFREIVLEELSKGVGSGVRGQRRSSER